MFKPSPKNDNFTIPFELKEDALLDWLLGLSKYPAQNACLLILQLLQALNKQSLSAKIRISFLNTLYNYLQEYMTDLEDSCWDASFPLSLNELHYAEIITWNYLALSRGFFIAAQDSNARTDEMFSLYMAYYGLGKAQIHIAAVYKKADKEFWQLAYEIFAWLEKYNLLDTPINDSDLTELTPQIQFAQMVIFHSCDTNQFRARDMRTFFNFLPNVCGDVVCLKLSDIKFQTKVLNAPYFQAIANRLGNLSEKMAHKINNRQDLFVFDMTKDNSPMILNPLFSLDDISLRYFTAKTVVEKLKKMIYKIDHQSGYLKSINHELFSRVIKTLEPGTKRKHARAETEDKMLGIIGFENIISFLYKVNNKNNMQTPALTSQPISSEELELYADKMQPEWSLVDDSFFSFDSHSSGSDNAIWENKNTLDITNRPVLIKRLTICDRSVNGYSLFWADDKNSKAKVGDIFAIISDDKKRLEVAIIRRIAVISEDDYKFGGEVLGLESEVVIIASSENRSVWDWAIFIQGIKRSNQADSIIYQIGEFHIEDCIYIYRKNKKIKATLSKELNITGAIVHAELNYSVFESAL